jgi:DNA-binding winged helix-turn-helix (wHTH) protein
MPAPVPTSRWLTFGPYAVDLHSSELRKNGARIRLQSQPFQLLAMLLERPGEVVTREEICTKLWPADTFVDFDHSLGTAVNKIREVLNDSAAKPRFVETVPRRGYRFIAPVTPVEPHPEPPAAPAEPVVGVAKSKSFYAVVGVGIAIALFSATLIVGNFHGWREGLLSKLTTQPPVRSIAVLPLLNLSTDP